MRIHNASTKATALSFSLVALFASTSCSPIQPKPKCKTQNADYAARYDVVGDTPAACMGKVLTGELLHVQTYYPDRDKASATPAIGIEADSAAAAAALEGSTVVQEYSEGNYSTVEPDNNELCTAPQLDDTDVTAPADMATMTPATHITYQWSNVQALTTPQSNAIYFGAELTRIQDDCTMKYTVSAVNPAVFCGDGVAMDPATGKPMLDDDGNPVPDPTTGNPVQDACDSSPESGTGLSPSIKSYTCDQTTLLCLPSAFADR